MNRKIGVLVLTGILAWTMAVSAGAADAVRLIPQSAGQVDTAQTVTDSTDVLDASAGGGGHAAHTRGAGGYAP